MKSFPNLGTTATIVKLASYCEETVEHRELLVGLGFGRVLDDGSFELTETGVAFDDAINAYSNVSDAMEFLRNAYLALPVVQALMQALHGRGCRRCGRCAPCGGAPQALRPEERRRIRIAALDAERASHRRLLEEVQDGDAPDQH